MIELDVDGNEQFKKYFEHRREDLFKAHEG